MPLSWYISHPRRLILVAAKRDIQPHDFARLFQSIDAAKASPYRKIFDVTGLATEFPPDLIGMFALWIRQREAERKSDRSLSSLALRGRTTRPPISPHKREGRV